MLKHFYANESDVPENLKGAYVHANGRYELDKLSDDVPIVETNKSLNQTNKTLSKTNGELQEKLTIAESKTLADGMVAVAPEVKELGEAAQGAGLKKPDIGNLKTRAEKAESDLAADRADRQIDEIADALGWKRGEFKRLAKDVSITHEDIKEKDGTTRKYFVAGKDADGKDTKVDIAEDANFKPFLSSLQIKEGEKGFQFGAPGKTESANVYDKIRESVKAKESEKTPDINERFGIAKTV